MNVIIRGETPPSITLLSPRVPRGRYVEFIYSTFARKLFPAVRNDVDARERCMLLPDSTGALTVVVVVMGMFSTGLSKAK